MEGTVITLKHEAGQRYRKILTILSSLIKGGLTDKEMDIVVELNNNGGELDADVRKSICDQLEISSDYLNNYVKKLRAKKVIIKDKLNDVLKVQPLPDDQEHMVVFRLLKQS